MGHFHRVNDDLYCEDVALARLIKEFGTPLFVYSKAEILENIGRMRMATKAADVELCYSVKANSNLSILRLIGLQGLGADIVSGGELFRALRAGISPQKIVFSGAGKTIDELRFALQQEIRMFNVESEPELEALSAVAQSMGKIAPIALRVNPDIDAGTHHYTTTAKKENKFGLPLVAAVEVYKKARSLPSINPIGVDVHLGSPILSLEPYSKALEILSSLIEQLRRLGIAISTLDIGGGYGIVYNNEQPFTPQQFADLLLPYAKRLQCSCILEPGRFVMGNSAVLLTTITYVKKTDAKLFYICDAGMNDLIRPALYGSFHDIVPVVLNGAGKKTTADIVGPICESSDFFAKDRNIDCCEQGASLAVKSAGAYGFSMSSQYNSRPRACEVLVDGSSYACIRRRETYEDLISQECIIN